MTGSEPDPNANTIHVGSRTWGEPAHTISPYADQLDKKILCGYICVGYNENQSSLSINLTRTFIVLPKYLNRMGTTRPILSFEPEQMDSTDLIDDWYYRYIEPNGHHQRIQFNLSTNLIISGNDILDLIPKNTINKSYHIKTTGMFNPLSVLK